jgi:histidinol phosphatase-like PHP family hydrolase
LFRIPPGKSLNTSKKEIISMARFDLHIHTESTAPYMKGDARLAPYHERGRAKQLAFMGISDHYHYFWQATSYVQQQRAHIDATGYSEPRVYLGVEQTILGDKGQIGIRGSGREELDYIILAIHWMSVGGRLGREAIASLLQSPEKRTKVVDTAKRYYQRAMTNPRLSRIPKIIGHPFNFLTSHHEPFPELLDALDWLCKTCAEHHVAYELNTDAVPRDVATASVGLDIYWEHLASVLNGYKTPVALGSDAHRLETIGGIDPLLARMDRFKICKQLLVDERFLNMGKST